MLRNTGQFLNKAKRWNLGTIFFKVMHWILHVPKEHGTQLVSPLGRNCQRTRLWIGEREKDRTPLKENSIWEATWQSIIQQAILPRDFQKLGHFSKGELSPWFWKAQEALAPVILGFLLSIFYEANACSQSLPTLLVKQSEPFLLVSRDKTTRIAP